MFFPYGSATVLKLSLDGTENYGEDDDDADVSTTASDRKDNGSADNTDNNSTVVDRSPPVITVCANRERLLMACLTSNAILIYSVHVHTLIVSYKRSKKSLAQQGVNEHILWKPDSSTVAVTTSNGYLLFYKLETDSQAQIYETREARQQSYKRNSVELVIRQRISKARFVPAAVVQLPSRATSLVSLKEEAFVSLANGWIHRLLWTGHVMEDYSTSVSRIPFCYDQMQAKAEYLGSSDALAASSTSLCLTSFVYSPLIGGFALVLSNGRGALLTSSSPAFHPSELRAVWAPGLQDAVCCAANHKYRLLTFGCRSSFICAYSVDETSGALVQAYQIRLVVMDNPEVANQLGAVRHLEWSPYGTTLGVSWANGGMAGFSVFGSQLWFKNDAVSSSFDWSIEGYQLWCGGNQLSLSHCIRPANAVNGSTGQSRRMIFTGADTLYLNPFRTFDTKAVTPIQSYWQHVTVPWNYIGYWWPIRFCALDDDQTSLCVAGSRGFVHCQLASNKWRLFGNETQEREMAVTGGLCFWKDYIVAGCYDIEKQTDEIRFYPKAMNLDNAFCTKTTLEAQVLFINIRNDVLLTFDKDNKCILYSITAEKRENGPVETVPRIRLERCAEIQLNDLVPHPVCVVSGQLIAKGGDNGSAKFCDDIDAILLNIAGRLVMLSPQTIDRRVNTKSGAASQEGVIQKQLEPPLLMASYVEDVWMDQQTFATDKPHLRQALWIQCGCRGMWVWMPLFPRGDGVLKDKPAQVQQQFISKRIMLPFELSAMHPLAVSSSECLVIGVELIFSNNTATVHRKSAVFLHHILRQLLKLNLGLYALEIAATCRDLKYFPHVLELLLHQVLEAEATSSEPIPDPLLPRVVAFLQEFPEFLQTIAHCARKTEMALWQHLFQTVGSAKDLFEVCIREKQLDTAASYFIILQNMESAIATKHHAALLLEAALENGRWVIASEIVRFLKAIDPEDLDSPPRTPLLFNKQAHSFSRLSLLSPANMDDADAFMFQTAHPLVRQRHSSIGNPSPNEQMSEAAATLNRKFSKQHQPEMVSPTGAQNANKKSVAKTSSAADAVPANKTISATARKASLGDRPDMPVDVFINLILTGHARDLLTTFKLQELGCFAAHLDIHLVSWLTKERSLSARVQNFPAALQKMHTDFQWPYPLLTYTLMEQLNKKIRETVSKPLHVNITPTMTNSSSADLKNDTLLNSHAVGRALDSNEQNTKGLLMNQLQHGLTCGSDVASVSSSRNVLLNTVKSGSVAADTEATDESWTLGADTNGDNNGNGNGQPDLDWECLEQLCGESVARGPHQKEAELRFMQQIVTEATCLEWALLICIILRDLVGLARAINASTLTTSPADTLVRLRRGLHQLDDWADKFCLGYKPILSAVQGYLDVFGKIDLAKTPEQPTSMLATAPCTVHRV